MGGQGSGRLAKGEKPIKGEYVWVPGYAILAVEEYVRELRRQWLVRRNVKRVARRVGTGNSLVRGKRRASRVTEAANEGFESPATPKEAK